MAVSGASSTVHAGRRTLPVLILAVLAATAVLVGLLAMHSLSVAVPLTLAQATTATLSQAEAAPEAPTTQVDRVSSLTAIPDATRGGSASLGVVEVGLLGCTLIAIACAVLLTLAALVFFGRVSKTDPWWRRDGAAVVIRFRMPPLHTYRPSLIALSISRT